VSLDDRQATSIAGVIERCECGRCCGVGPSPCQCGQPSTARRPLVAGDHIVALSLRRPPTRRPAAIRAATAIAATAAQANSTLPPTAFLILSVSQDLVTRVVEEVRRWSGSETAVNIPVRVRPLLAEVFAELLLEMVSGSVVAGLLMQCFPKLVLHRAALRMAGIGSTAATIARRATLFLRGQLDELLTLIREERAAPHKVTAKRSRRVTQQGKAAIVRNMARHGAFSKAVRRLGSSIAEYDDDTALSWAQRLIPNPPPDTTTLGATPISDTERSHLRTIRTCAPDILHSTTTSPTGSDPTEPPTDDVDAEPVDPALCDAADDDAQPQDVPPPRRPTTTTRHKFPSPNAYATGVRFDALSAPGPSGLRAEHLRAFGSGRRARPRQRFDEAMRTFIATAIRGELPHPSCWWLTDSSLTFARKPGADDAAAPRPLRVGETLRRYVAKRIAAAERDHVRKTLIRHRQFGVACPGGAEVVIHYRIASRLAQTTHIGDQTADWEIDLQNCFGSAFWTAIDEAVQRHAPGALPWTRWCHSAPVKVILAGGRHHTVQRGGAEGVPRGPQFTT
jgi:hypothetical protein